LFGEGSGGFLVSGEGRALEAMAAGGVDVSVLGEVGGSDLQIEVGGDTIRVGVETVGAAWRSLGQRLASIS
jgi:hypothetical protein